jgi:hypothetical protein
MRKIITLLCLLIFAEISQSQPIRRSRISSGVDVGAGFQTGVLAPSFEFYQLLQTGKRSPLQLGWSFRATQLIGKELTFLTAPATKNIDSLYMGQATMLSFNMGIKAQINVGPLELGAGADLLGVTLGRRRTGFHSGSTGVVPKSDTLNTTVHLTDQSARPTTGNLIAFGDYVRGSLTADVYARLWISKAVGLKVGYQFLVNEYKTENPMVADNRRFRYRSELLYIGISFPIAN